MRMAKGIWTGHDGSIHSVRVIACIWTRFLHGGAITGYEEHT